MKRIIDILNGGIWLCIGAFLIAFGVSEITKSFYAKAALYATSYVFLINVIAFCVSAGIYILRESKSDKK